MPAPVVPQNKYSEIADNHSTIYWQRQNALNQAYDSLQNYNPTGAGAMPYPTEWRVPNTNYFMKYDPSSYGEIVLNNNAYSSLNPAEKRIIYKYLDKFFKYCLEVYDQNYNL